jgi:hypothetical protein
MSALPDETDSAQGEGKTDAVIPNGSAAAAILAAGGGCFLVSVCAWLGDAFPAMGRLFNFYNPTGPLSGVTTTAIVIWLILWFVLSKIWGEKSVPMGKINTIAFLLLGIGLLLTFPPFGDFLQGK